MVMSKKKFAVHEIWFYDSGEYLYSENELSFCVATFDTPEAAQAKQKALDIEYLRGLLDFGNRVDCIFPLTYFLEQQQGRGKKTQNLPTQHLIDYAREQGWNKGNIKGTTADGYKLYLPKEVSNDQLWQIAQITGAFFYRVVAYEEVKSSMYIKFNQRFWAWKVLQKMQEKGFVTEGNPSDFEKTVPYYDSNEDAYYIREMLLLRKPDEGEASFWFDCEAEALETAAKVTLHYLNTCLPKCLMGKTYLEDWSDTPALLLNYLKTCQTFQLETIRVTVDNFGTFTDKLKRLKSDICLKEGDVFYQLNIPNVWQANYQELRRLMEFMKVKPYQVKEIIKEVNGEKIKILDKG